MISRNVLISSYRLPSVSHVTGALPVNAIDSRHNVSSVALLAISQSWEAIQALYYHSDLTPSQEFHPMAAQLSLETALTVAKMPATASDRCNKTRPGRVGKGNACDAYNHETFNGFIYVCLSWCTMSSQSIGMGFQNPTLSNCWRLISTPCIHLKMSHIWWGNVKIDITIFSRCEIIPRGWQNKDMSCHMMSMQPYHYS